MMGEQELKDQLNRLENKLDSIENLVTNLRIEQAGLKVKSSIFGLIGGALIAIPSVVAVLIKGM